MKTVKFFLGALAIAAISAIAAPEAAAANEKECNKGPYLTNTWKDNWFVSGAAGFNVFFDNGTYTGIGLDFNVGKWFTPEIGMRVGANGITGKSGKFVYPHADFMWNASNTFSGYNPQRIWTIVPYAHYGFMWDPSYVGREMAGGFGIYNVLNLVKSWEKLNFIVDLRGNVFKGQGPAAYLSANVGVVYDFGKNTFTRASDYHNPKDVDKITAAEAAIAALTAANAALLDQKKDLEQEKVAAVEKQEQLAQEVKRAEEESGIKDIAPASFYFEIGQTVLSQKELAHLDFYLKNILPNVKNGKATVVTGTADSNTGYAKRNQYLSKKRAEYLINLLNTKYGVETSDIVVKNQVIRSVNGKAALDRAVVISFE